MFSKLRNIWNQRNAYMDLLAHWGLKYNYELEILNKPDTRILHIAPEMIVAKKFLEKDFGQKDHVRLYGTNYPSKLESCGFVVNTLKLQQKHPKFGFNPEEVLFIGRK